MHIVHVLAYGFVESVGDILSTGSFLVSILLMSECC